MLPFYAYTPHPYFQQRMVDEYKNIEVIVEIRTESPVNKKICMFSKI